MAISLFAPMANDLSVEYLYTIFGSVNGVINPASVQLETGVTTVTLLGTMFKTFNSIILAVGAFILVYVTVVGVMATAHEGQFMGKKWNNMWLPIRTVLGISALVPTASGYSGIQIIMMWLILQGVGAADSIWNTTLGFLNKTGSPYAKVALMMEKNEDGSKSPVSFATTGVLAQTFQAITCDRASRAKALAPGTTTTNYVFFTLTTIGGAPYFCGLDEGGKDKKFCGQDMRDVYSLGNLREKDTMEFGPDGSCGILTYCNYKKACTGTKSDPASCRVCKGQTEALSLALNQFAMLADMLNSVDYNYRVFKFNYDLAKKNSSEDEEPKLPPKPASVENYCKQYGSDCTSFPDSAPNAGSASNAVRQLYWPFIAETVFNISDVESIPEDSNVNFIKIIGKQYEQMVADPLAAVLMEQAGDATNLKGKYAEAANEGWILAGGYYQLIARQSKRAVDLASPILGFELPENPVGISGNDLSKCAKVSVTTGKGDDEKTEDRDVDCRTNMEAAKILMQLAAGNKNVGSGVTTQQGSAVSGVLGDATQAATSTMQVIAADSSQGIGATDPVAQLILAGSLMMNLAAAAYGYILFLVFVGGIIASINVMAFGSGLSENPLKTGMIFINNIIIPATLAFLAMLISMGATFSVYVPMIPYVIFTLGVIGWYTTVIEAMVAGPLVALGILSPSGQHELLGKAEGAIAILFNLCLRPTLMIFGFIAAILLAGPMIDLLTRGMSLLLAGNALAFRTPVGFVLWLVVYVSLTVTVLNKCFAAIHIIPENVGRWIGMAGERYGESAEELKGAVGAGAGKMAQAGAAAEGARKPVGEAQAAKEKAKSDQSNSSIQGGQGDGKKPGGSK